MRTASIESCEIVFRNFSLALDERPAIDVGGTEEVYLATRYKGTVVGINPIASRCPGITYLDKGFNIDHLSTRADTQIDFLDQSKLNGLARRYRRVYCFDTLEHVSDPLQFCANLAHISAQGAWIYLSTLFSYEYHPSPQDYFRYTPEGLRLLMSKAGQFSGETVSVVWAGWETDGWGVGVLVHKGEFSGPTSSLALPLQRPSLRWRIRAVARSVRDVFLNPQPVAGKV